MTRVLKDRRKKKIRMQEGFESVDKKASRSPVYIFSEKGIGESKSEGIERIPFPIFDSLDPRQSVCS